MAAAESRMAARKDALARAKSRAAAAKNALSAAAANLDSAKSTGNEQSITSHRAAYSKARKKYDEAVQACATHEDEVGSAQAEIDAAQSDGAPAKGSATHYKPDKPLSYNADEYLDLISWMIKMARRGGGPLTGRAALCDHFVFGSAASSGGRHRYGIVARSAGVDERTLRLLDGYLYPAGADPARFTRSSSLLVLDGMAAFTQARNAGHDGEGRPNSIYSHTILIDEHDFAAIGNDTRVLAMQTPHVDGAGDLRPLKIRPLEIGADLASARSLGLVHLRPFLEAAFSGKRVAIRRPPDPGPPAASPVAAPRLAPPRALRHHASRSPTPALLCDRADGRAALVARPLQGHRHRRRALPRIAVAAWQVRRPRGAPDIRGGRGGPCADTRGVCRGPRTGPQGQDLPGRRRADVRRGPAPVAGRCREAGPDIGLRPRRPGGGLLRQDRAISGRRRTGRGMRRGTAPTSWRRSTRTARSTRRPFWKCLTAAGRGAGPAPAPAPAPARGASCAPCLSSGRTTWGLAAPVLLAAAAHRQDAQEIVDAFAAEPALRPAIFRALSGPAGPGCRAPPPPAPYGTQGAAAVGGLHAPCGPASRRRSRPGGRRGRTGVPRRRLLAVLRPRRQGRGPRHPGRARPRRYTARYPRNFRAQGGPAGRSGANTCLAP